MGRTPFTARVGITLWIVVGWAATAACSGSNNGSVSSTGGVEQASQACSQASQCYGLIDASALRGEVTCLSQLQNGYCTHTCTSDSDCCAAPGECVTGLKQVCASFESSGKMYCFVSCAASDVSASPDGGAGDSAAYCQTWNPSFTCRSTGGGSNNQKFCGP